MSNLRTGACNIVHDGSDLGTDRKGRNTGCLFRNSHGQKQMMGLTATNMQDAHTSAPVPLQAIPPFTLAQGKGGWYCKVELSCCDCDISM